MAELKLTLKTLTPLWTGGVDKICDRLHETGIIGSLRWWYEAIVRGLGGKVCNATSKREAERCRFNPDSYEKAKKEDKSEREALLKAGVCDVCQSYGATGYGRRFKGELKGGKLAFEDDNIFIPSGRIRIRRRRGQEEEYPGGWYLGPGYVGNLRFEVISLHKSFSKVTILVPLVLAARWGGLGARVQHGYGVVKALREDGEEVKVAEELLAALPKGGSTYNDDFPNIQDFFFARFYFMVVDKNWWRKISGLKQALERKVQGRQFKELKDINTQLGDWIKNGSVPIAPAIKNWLRFESNIISTNDYGKQNYVFGTTEKVCPRCYNRVREDRQDPSRFWCGNCHNSFPKKQVIERVAAKINISCAYLIDEKQWEFRIWGWLPRKMPKNISPNRDAFLQDLKAKLQDKKMWQDVFGKDGPIPELICWMTCEDKDAEGFLRKLLLDY
jgi:CRISPR-associated protein Cmr1